MSTKKDIKNTSIQQRVNTALAQANQVNEAFGGNELQIPRNASLPTIGIMRETAQFQMPDGSLTTSFVANILHYHYANLYYSKKFGEGEATAPDCASSDGLIPDGGTNMLPGPCAFCSKNQYGSALEGFGKSCSNNLWLYVLVEGEVLPSILKAPPSSLNKKGSLLTWLTSAPNIASKAGLGIKYQPIKVKFSLRKKTFASGMSASVVELSTVRPLDLNKSSDKAEYHKIVSIWQGLKDSYFNHIKENVAANLSEAAKTDDNDSSSDDTDTGNASEGVPNPDWVGDDPTPPDDDIPY